MKAITETFGIKVGNGVFHITARNFNKHWIDFGTSDTLYLTLDDMKKVSDHLQETIKKIEADFDFNPPQ